MHRPRLCLNTSGSPLAVALFWAPLPGYHIFRASTTSSHVAQAESPLPKWSTNAISKYHCERYCFETPWRMSSA